MPELLVDGRSVAVPSGATLLGAARSLGIPIPTLCFQEGLPHHTSCMLCLVEDLDSGRLVPACATPAVEGQAVRTSGERVLAARRRSLELLLGEHAGDCEAPCVRACPAHADVPAMIRRLVKADGVGALAAILERLPLAGTLAYICPAPCERSCRRRLVDAPVQICALKKAATDAGLGPGVGKKARPGASEADPFFTPRAAPATGKRVAIVGAGPAGLAAAYFLARAGHRCRVLDERPEPGGMIRYAVGADRLPPAVLDADLAVLRRLGVEWELGRAVAAGKDLGALRAGHDALVLATGSAERLAALLPGGERFDRDTGACASPGVFAGGNATRGRPTRLAVRSVAEGRMLAHSVDRFLSGRPVTAERPRFDSRLGSLEPPDLERMVAAAARRAERVKADGGRAATAAREAEGAAASGAAAGGAPASRVLDEALRCLDCDCSRRKTCRLRRLADELGADARRFPGEEAKRFERASGTGGLSFEPGKCIKCGICVRIAERGGDRPGLAFTGRGFDLRLRVPFNVDIGTALPATAAECVARCPTGALAWER
jgi:ferredoxin